MNVKFHHVTLAEADRIHEKFATAFRAVGLKDAELDVAIASVFGEAITEIERNRQAKIYARARLKIVD